MRFTPSFLEEVRDRIPIADVVGRRVAFDRKKSNPAKGDFWGCCPFHGEKTPSFHCENQKGRYHCFGCGASGDHFKFMTELDGLSFPEAVERLADEAGITLPAVDPQAARKAEKRASLYDVMEMAAQFFREQLQTAEGANARAYLRDRGLSGKIQQEFGIGYAPSSRSALKEYLGSKGVEKNKIEACGLVVYGPEIAISYDRFRDRVMFPILDARGRCIAFGGRALSSDVPAKYLNSPETELFSKSNILYNYAKARRANERDESLIVAEGYMDVVAMTAAGFENAVAPLGTALTEQQIELAWRISREPVLCFDGDEAGQRAAYRSIDTAFPGLKPGRSLRFAILPQGEDPDDLIKRAGAGAFVEILENARPLADMIWNRETAGRTFDTPERRAELERTLFGTVKAIVDENVRRHYQQDVKERLAAYFGTVKRDTSFDGKRGNVDSYRQNARRGSQQRRLAVSDSLMNSSLVRAKTSAPPLRESALLVTVANHPAIGLAHFDEFSGLECEHPAWKSAHSALLNIFVESGEDDDQLTLEDVERRLEEAHMSETLAALAAQVRNNRIWQALTDASFEDAREGWLQAYHLHERSHVLEAELKDAERDFDEIGDEASFERLVHAKEQLASDHGMDALIEGFGRASGRPARSL
ncbi:MAG: DNA primase [Rhizobiaceae bacterium]